MRGRILGAVSRLAFWQVALLALALRAAWAVAIPVDPVSDSHAYDTFARNLAFHGTFGWLPDQPFAFWPPGMPALYAAVYLAFGAHYGALVVLHILLGVAIVLVSMVLARRWFGDLVAGLTGIILAVWPSLVMFSTVLASELAFMLLMLLAAECWTRPSLGLPARGLASGVFLGLAALVRPLALPFPLVFAVSALLAAGTQRLRDRSSWRGQIGIAVLAGVSMILVIAPWTVRNYRLYGELILISTNGGTTFWMGNTPGTSGGYARIPDWALKLRDNEQARRLSEEARDYIVREPVEFLQRSARKAVHLYNHESIAVAWNEPGIRRRLGEAWVNPLKVLTNASWLAILCAAVWGAISGLRSPPPGVNRASLAWPGISILFLTGVHSVIVAQDRYHLGFSPLIAMFAGIGLASFLRR